MVLKKRQFRLELDPCTYRKIWKYQSALDVSDVEKKTYPKPRSK